MKIFRYCNGPVHWGSKAQQAQALSSAGAELTALTEATGDGIAIREAAYELNLPQREPMKMFTDNRAAVFIGEDAAAVRKSKADSRHAIFLQETVEEGIMELKHWPGKDNVADIGTKWLIGMILKNTVRCLSTCMRIANLAFQCHDAYAQWALSRRGCWTLECPNLTLLRYRGKTDN